MEYVTKINIFGLNMMVKSSLEKIILKFLHAQNNFFYFIKMPQNWKLSDKNYLICAWRDFIKTFCDACTLG